ncbi:MAG: dienelactone hydrolase family protein [Planctomycetota bacterium]
MRSIVAIALAATLVFAVVACSSTGGDQSGNSATSGTPDIHTEVVTYEAGGVQCKGFVAYDKARKGKRPGVLVVHEWWGQTDYPRNRCRMLAALGYVAFAVDMYGEGKLGENPEEAGKLATGVFSDMANAKARFTVAHEWLKNNEMCDADHIAAIGYCFGGGIVLAMARAGEDLDGVVSFHGMLATETPAKAGEVKAHVLVCHGADDQFVPAEQVEAFKKEMSDAGVDMKFIAYPDSTHAFTNPEATAKGKEFGIPVAYNEAADKKSWEDMKMFFHELFEH